MDAGYCEYYIVNSLDFISFPLNNWILFWLAVKLLVDGDGDGRDGGGRDGGGRDGDGDYWDLVI